MKTFITIITFMLIQPAYASTIKDAHESEKLSTQIMGHF